MKELTSGEPIIDEYANSGRKRIDTKLSHLIKDIKLLVDSQSQADPSCKSAKLVVSASVPPTSQDSKRLYTRISSRGWDIKPFVLLH
jgi:hypothetical protein